MRGAPVHLIEVGAGDDERGDRYQPADRRADAEVLVGKSVTVEIGGEDFGLPCRPAAGENPHLAEDTKAEDVAEHQRDKDRRHKERNSDAAQLLPTRRPVDRRALVKVLGNAEETRIEQEETEGQMQPDRYQTDERQSGPAVR